MLRFSLFIFVFFVFSCKPTLPKKHIKKSCKERLTGLSSFIGCIPTHLYPTAPVYAFLPTDSCLYLGTGGGLFKYTGKELIHVAHFKSAVIAIEKGDNGTLYIGTEHKGLFKLLKGDKFVKNRLFPEGKVNCILKSSKGSLFVGYDGLGIYTLQNKKLYHFNIRKGPVDAGINCLTEFYGEIVLGTNAQGLWVWNKNSWKRFGPWKYKKIGFLTPIQNHLSVGIYGGLYLLDIDGNILSEIAHRKQLYTAYVSPFIGTENGFHDGETEFGKINSLCFWKGRRYAGTTKGFLKQTGARWKKVLARNTLLGRNTASIFQSRKTLLIAQMTGISNWNARSNKISTIKVKDATFKYCSAIAKKNDIFFFGFLCSPWLYGKLGSLKALQRTKIDTFPPSAQSIRIFNNSVYLVDRRNVFVYNGIRVKHLCSSPFPLTDVAIVGNKIYLGSYGRGLCLLRDDGNVQMLMHAANKHNKGLYIKTLYPYGNKGLWIGTWHDGLYKLDQEIPVKADLSITSIALSKSGRLWVGTYANGIHCLEKGHWYRFKEELLSPQISCIVLLEKGGMAYSTFRHGISVYYSYK